MLARLRAPLFSGVAAAATALGLYTRPQRSQCEEQQQIGVRVRRNLTFGPQSQRTRAKPDSFLGINALGTQADGVVLAFDGKAMRVMLVKRKQDPHIGRWVSKNDRLMFLAFLLTCAF